MSASRRSSGGFEATAGGKPLTGGRYPKAAGGDHRMTRPINSTQFRLAIVGRGRVGTALARAFAAAGIELEGPLGRGERPQADVVLLCVPDGEIANAAAAVDARF